MLATAHDAPPALVRRIDGLGDVAGFRLRQTLAQAIANIRDYRPLAQVVHAAGETHSSLILTIAKRWPRHDPGALITALHELARANSDEIDNEEHFL